MGVIWDKVWFDLWQRKGRTLLAVVSIAVGVFSIGAIFGMVDLLLSRMNAAHRAVQPAHMSLILRQPIDRETAESILSVDGVVGVEPLNIITIRFKQQPDDLWESATLVMRDDFSEQTYDWVVLREGAWPSDNQLGVERLTSQTFDYEIGDELIVELAGTDRAFPITGKIRHPFVPPPDFGGGAYFFIDSEGLTRFGFPEGRFTQLFVRVEPYSEEYAKDRAVAIKEHFAKQGVGVNFVFQQDPDTHWGADIMQGVTVVLQVLAVVSLLTSVIIVVNTMTAVITQQTDQIGVIKAIGGTSDIILRIYMVGVLVYGALALLVSLPLGMLTAFFATGGLLNFFNIDYTIFEFSNRAVLFQVLAALAAPLVAALWPVLNGATMSVREAIATYGLGGDFGSSRLDRWVERTAERFFSSPYAIALGNMFRRKGRLALTQIVLVTAGAMFIMVLTLAQSLTLTLDNELARRAYDIRFNFIGVQRADRVVQMAKQMPGVVEAEGWFSVTGNVLQAGEQMEDTGGLGAELFGIPLGSNMYLPLIVDGRWLLPDETGNVVVISKETADFNDIAVGETITIDLGELGDGEWQVVGVYKAISPDVFSTDPMYAPETAVVNATKRANRATQLVIRTADKDAASTAAMMTELRTMYEERGINDNSFFSRSKGQDREFAFNQFAILLNMLLGLAGVMGLVGGISLAGSLAISVVERTREIGVLRSIGGESPTIMSMFIMEGVLQGMLSWLIAVPVGFLVARPMALLLGTTVFETELDFSFSYTAVLIWLGLILVISVLASLLPAFNATRISVRESLAYG